MPISKADLLSLQADSKTVDVDIVGKTYRLRQPTFREWYSWVREMEGYEDVKRIPAEALCRTVASLLVQDDGSPMFTADEAVAFNWPPTVLAGLFVECRKLMMQFANDETEEQAKN
jgi:hypothetical protein